jgi:hypothetical protein
MLTTEDGRSDGRFLSYLYKPEKWKDFDPQAFEAMRRIVCDHKHRDVSLVESSGVLPDAVFFTSILHDNRDGRAEYFADANTALQSAQLLFFDPDNGLEVSSVPVGRKGSQKYLYWEDLRPFFVGDRSLLIYQHFPREERRTYIRRRATEIATALGQVRIYSFRTAYVCFFLVTRVTRLCQYVEARIKELERQWRGQFQVEYHGND